GFFLRVPAARDVCHPCRSAYSHSRCIASNKERSGQQRHIDASPGDVSRPPQRRGRLASLWHNLPVLLRWADGHPVPRNKPKRQKVMIDRAKQGPVTWDMWVTVGEPGDPETHPTAAKSSRPAR